ncbi:MAG: hypothetical protein GX596_06370, partial [Propionibacterium sp.]|nr:hypothetical protein [Propionibacterium sp.]
MPERIPELDRFLTHTEETPMMPASEVRRRGDRRRTVRRSAMGAGALALTVVAGFGLAQTPLFDGRAPDPDAIPLPADPTSEPAPTWPQSEEPRPTDPAAPAPSWANVPAADELFHAEVPAEVRAEQEGLPQAALSFCDPGAYGDP